jgi:hypothetical protein
MDAMITPVSLGYSAPRRWSGCAEVIDLRPGTVLRAIFGFPEPTIRAIRTTTTAPMVAITMRLIGGLRIPSSIPSLLRSVPPTNAPMRPVIR